VMTIPRRISVALIIMALRVAPEKHWRLRLQTVGTDSTSAREGRVADVLNTERVIKPIPGD